MKLFNCNTKIYYTEDNKSTVNFNLINIYYLYVLIDKRVAFQMKSNPFLMIGGEKMIYREIRAGKQGVLESPVGMNQPAKRVDIVKLKMVKESSLLYKERRVKSPEDASLLFKQFLDGADREFFIVLCLDIKNQPTAINVCHIGSLNSSIVHPREVLKPAIISNAASIIVAHNHPSNDPTPSREDLEVTKRLIEAGKVVGIEVLDHLIVCEESFTSLKEKGHM